MGSHWNHTSEDMVHFLESLASNNDTGYYHGIVETVRWQLSVIDIIKSLEGILMYTYTCIILHSHVIQLIKFMWLSVNFTPPSLSPYYYRVCLLSPLSLTGPFRTHESTTTSTWSLIMLPTSVSINCKLNLVIVIVNVHCAVEFSTWSHALQ